jgi:hypothetical protein
MQHLHGQIKYNYQLHMFIYAIIYIYVATFSIQNISLSLIYVDSRSVHLMVNIYGVRTVYLPLCLIN